MKTLTAAFLLLVFAFFASIAQLFLLNIAGLPGALLAGKPGLRSKQRFVFGSVIAALGQSYVNLAFVAFVVCRAYFFVRGGAISFIVWPMAFFAVFAPTFLNVIRARVEARELKSGNPQVEALHITLLATVLAFVVFGLFPTLMRPWNWMGGIVSTEM